MVSEKPIRYEKIDSGKLYEGMFMDADLFCRYKNNFVLVFKSALLTEKLIRKIKQLEEVYGSLYVESSNYDKLLDQFKTYDSILKSMEFSTNYKSIKSKTTGILDSVARKNVVPLEASNIASEIILDKVMSVDPAVIFQLINSVRSVDEYLYSHSTNVAFLNGLIGKWMGMSETEISSIVAAGLLHDVGKTKIPKQILNKPGKLTKDEFEIIKLHPMYSYDILKNSGEVNETILLAAKHHHEKINGSGYPDGLKYDNIPLPARITAVSDVYDAMVTNKSYRASFSPFDVLEEFSRGSFSNLDLDIINIFLKNMPCELIGKSVLLSNGAVGKVVYIDPNDYSYPLVQVANDLIQTDNVTRCVCMCSTNIEQNTNPQQ